jgi:hypothetical protein
LIEQSGGKPIRILSLIARERSEYLVDGNEKAAGPVAPGEVSADDSNKPLYQPLTNIPTHSVLSNLKKRPTETLMSHHSSWTLSIDKLSLVRYDPIPTNVGIVCDRLLEAVESGRFAGAICRGTPRHRIQIAIPIQVIQAHNLHSPGTLLIQAGPRMPGLCDYRIEFNPARIGPAGVERVMAILDSMFDAGGREFVKNALVTRTDAALDLHGLSVEKVIVRSSKSRVHGIFSNQKGLPETTYFGTPKTNQTAAYTKYHGGVGDPSLRIERRMKPKCRGNQLAFLPNPFRVVQMVHTDLFLPFLDGTIPDHFFDSVRVRGLSHVLATLPSAQRRAINAAIKDPAQSLLPSIEEVWLEWPALLESSGLGFLVPATSADVPLAPSETIHANPVITQGA